MDSRKFYRGTRVQPQAKRKPWFQVMPIVGVVALVVALIWIASKYHGYVNLGYEITELRDGNQTLKVEQDKLLSELARLQRPDRVMREMLAMGLQRVAPNQRYTIHFDFRPGEDQPVTRPEGQSETLVAFSDNEP